MRKILFRGKFAEKQTQNTISEQTKAQVCPDGWVYGFYVPERSETPLGETKQRASIIKTGDPKKLTTGMWFDVDENTVGEFTGLTDKNGKDIYEGDIVRYNEIGTDAEPTVDQIVYGCAHSYPAFDLANHDFECNALSLLCTDKQYEVEVIGNIYDNPELLQEV